MAVCPDGHQSASDDFCDVCGLRIGRMSQAQPAGDPWGSPSRAPGAPGMAGWPGDPSRQAPPGAAGDAPAGHPACPHCGTGRTGRFCEGCGLDYSTGRLPDGSLVAAIDSGVLARPGCPSLLAHPVPASGVAGTASVICVARVVAGAALLIAAGSFPGGWAAPSRPDRGPSSGPAPPWPSPQAATWSVVVSADRAYYDEVRAVSGPDGEAIDFPAYCAERQFTLSGAAMKIGRHSTSRGVYPEIDLTGPPTDPGVSRLHAVLIARPPGWSVLDPGSANGTQVNGTEIPQNEEVPLRDGDLINVGAWTAITVRHR